MQSINIHDATTNLSKLLELVSNGEKFIIAKAGKPIAMLSPTHLFGEASIKANLGKLDVNR